MPHMVIQCLLLHLLRNHWNPLRRVWELARVIDFFFSGSPYRDKGSFSVFWHRFKGSQGALWRISSFCFFIPFQIEWSFLVGRQRCENPERGLRCKRFGLCLYHTEQVFLTPLPCRIHRCAPAAWLSSRYCHSPDISVIVLLPWDRIISLLPKLGGQFMHWEDSFLFGKLDIPLKRLFLIPVLLM